MKELFTLFVLVLVPVFVQANETIDAELDLNASCCHQETRQDCRNYANFYTHATPTIPQGSPIAFDRTQLIRGFFNFGDGRIRVEHRGTYDLEYFAQLAPLAPGATIQLEVNGILIEAGRHTAIPGAVVVGQVLVKLLSGDIIRIVNPLNSLGAFTISNGGDPFSATASLVITQVN